MGTSMKIQDFEKELQAIHPDLTIRPNDAPKRVLEAFPDVNKLASILYCGVEICSIPNEHIYEERSSSYGVDLRGDGRFVAHRSRPEALAMVNERLAQLNNKEYSDQFFGRGEYSDAALNKKDEVVAELVEEVPIDLKEVSSGMIEGPK